MLTEINRIPTTGARAVEPFRHDGTLYLVIPQLAADAPGQAPSMIGGNSDVDSLVLTWRNGCCAEHQRLPITGGEDAEFFRIGERAFLATATLRSGQGPYRYDVASTIFELAQGAFVPFQTVATFGAKQWKHFTVPAPEAVPMDRISLVFFQNPNPDTVIRCLESCVRPGETEKYPPITVAEHCLGKLMKAGHSRIDAKAEDALTHAKLRESLTTH
jgi:hypothetical protein